MIINSPANINVQAISNKWTSCREFLKTKNKKRRAFHFHVYYFAQPT